jgi:hypothetical protein
MANLFTVENITKGGIIGLLLIILVTGFTGVWVYGPSHKAEIVSLEKQLTTALAEREEWRKLAIEGLRVSREVSAARVPILGANPNTEVSPEDVADQLRVIQNLNNSEADGVTE